MGRIELSKRLSMVAGMVTDSKVVADIGCDHAYTSIYLVENNLADKVIAMDVNKGPVEIAKKNIKLYNVEEQIDVRLSDGTAKLEEDEADTLLISGMGGALIVKILAMRPDILSKCKYLVLSPQSEIFLVRQYLENVGFQIIEEDMVKDEGKFYVGIKAKNTYKEVTLEAYKLVDNSSNIGNISVYDRFGKYLLDNKHPVLKEYLEHSLKQYEEILANLKNAHINKPSEATAKRIDEVLTVIEDTKEGMKCYGM